MGMTLFACMDAVSKHLTTSLPIVEILWVRYALFTLFGLLMALSLGGIVSLRTKMLKLQIVRGFAMLGDIALFTLSFRFMQLAEAHAIAAIAPLMVMAFAVPLLGEKVSHRQWMAVSTGLIGVLVIVRPETNLFQPISILPFLATVSFSLYIILTRLVGKYDNLATSVFYTGVIGLTVLTAVAPFYWRTPTAEEGAWLVAASCLGVWAHICVIRGLSLSEASILQPFNYVLLVGAIILGFVVFGNFPNATTVVGALIVIVSGLYAWYLARVSDS